MKKLRDGVISKQGIDDEGIMGWVWICCFGLCAMIQEVREVGVDPLAMGEEIQRV